MAFVLIRILGCIVLSAPDGSERLVLPGSLLKKGRRFLDLALLGASTSQILRKRREVGGQLNRDIKSFLGCAKRYFRQPDIFLAHPLLQPLVLENFRLGVFLGDDNCAILFE